MKIHSSNGAGTERYSDYWNKDLTLKKAFNLSAVWYFEKVANEVGKENLSKFVSELSYGNYDTSEEIPFWLNSTIKISPKEQVEFISNLFEYKFPIDKNHIDILKIVMQKGTINSGTLYGKTDTSSEGNNSWLVGAYEKDNEYLYFAVRLSDGENVPGAEAEKITRDIIENYFNKFRVREEKMIEINQVETIDEEIAELIGYEFEKYANQFGLSCNYSKFCFVAKESKKIIGVLTGNTIYTEVHIGELIVLPDYRNKGIGKQLVLEVENKFKNTDFDFISLTTYEFQARKFYEKCGFKLEFVRKNKENKKLTKYFFVKYF